MAENSWGWLAESNRADDTYLRRGEPITDWLKRATVPRAKECRRFLNENLSSLPRGHQRVLYRALHDRWHSAFFELIVARTLQVLGTDIDVEPGCRVLIRTKTNRSGADRSSDCRGPSHHVTIV